MEQNQENKQEDFEEERALREIVDSSLKGLVWQAVQPMSELFKSQLYFEHWYKHDLAVVESLNDGKLRFYGVINNKKEQILIISLQKIVNDLAEITYRKRMYDSWREIYGDERAKIMAEQVSKYIGTPTN